jgi:hypothetical protein
MSTSQQVSRGGNPRNTFEVPINQITFEQFQALKPRLVSWIYPKRIVSSFLPLFSSVQRAAIDFYGWIAMLMAPVSLVLAFVTGIWWWLALAPFAYAVWNANRRSMEQFFIENVENYPAFFEAVRSAQDVKIVLLQAEDQRDDNMDADLIDKVVQSYAATLEGANGRVIRDTSELPYPKNVIRSALLIYITMNKDDEHALDALKCSYLCLADFQPLSEKRRKALWDMKTPLTSTPSGEYFERVHGAASIFTALLVQCARLLKKSLVNA